MTDAIVDAGPIVAFFDPGEGAHEWAGEAFRRLRLPLVTCEPALAEAMHLLRFSSTAQETILEWLGTGTLQIAFDLTDDLAAVRKLMRKYRDVPMSLADACLVRMAETFDDHAVCTLDRDFRVYRKNGATVIPLLIPDER